MFCNFNKYIFQFCPAECLDHFCNKGIAGGQQGKELTQIYLPIWTNTYCNFALQKVPGSVFATRESLLEARRSIGGGGEVKPERPQGGTGWARERSRWETR